MIYARWNSPAHIRSRAIDNVKAEANRFGCVLPDDKIDNTYTHGQLLENAERLLKDAVNDSLSRDLHEVAKVCGSLKSGTHEALCQTSNTKDFGIGSTDEYKMPDGWDLPTNTEIWDQRDRLAKAAALILMEIERLDRIRVNGRKYGQGIFDPVHIADAKAGEAASLKQSKRQRKQQQLDIYQQMADTTVSNFSIAGSNVTASTQSQFAGAIQPMPEAVSCPVHRKKY